jgi:hypothetical protein
MLYLFFEIVSLTFSLNLAVNHNSPKSTPMCMDYKCEPPETSYFEIILFVYFYFCCLWFRVLLKKSIAFTDVLKYFPYVFFQCYIILGLLFRFSTYLNYILYKRYGSGFICLCMDIQFSQHHLLKWLAFLQHSIFLNNHLAIDVWIWFWDFYSVPLVCMLVFLPLPYVVLLKL